VAGFRGPGPVRWCGTGQVQPVPNGLVRSSGSSWAASGAPSRPGPVPASWPRACVLARGCALARVWVGVLARTRDRAAVVAGVAQVQAGELIQDVPVDVPAHDRGQRRITRGGVRLRPGQIHRSGDAGGGGAGGAPACFQPGGAGQAAQLGQVHVHSQVQGLAVAAGQHPGLDQPRAALVTDLYRDLGHISLPYH
jgi:hypothetical protein